MLIGTVNGYDVYLDTFIRNHAFGRRPETPNIFGFRGAIVATGLPQNDASAVRFENEEHEGYRDSALAQTVGSNLGRELAAGLPAVKR